MTVEKIPASVHFQRETDADTHGIARRLAACPDDCRSILNCFARAFHVKLAAGNRIKFSDGRRAIISFQRMLGLFGESLYALGNFFSALRGAGFYFFCAASKTF